MTIPEWLKPACYGSAAGVAALTALGFDAPGWTSAGGAAQAADAQSKAAVIAALTPICVDMARRDVGAPLRWTASRRRSPIRGAIS